MKKQQGLTLTELMFVLVIVGILSSFSLITYKEFMIDARWGKTIAGLRALKLAVENCLSDKNSIYTECDSLDDGKVGAYGIHKYADETADFAGIVLQENTAAIQITGKAPLSWCILKIIPSFSVADGGIIRWKYIFNDQKCVKYVKTSIVS